MEPKLEVGWVYKVNIVWEEESRYYQIKHLCVWNIYRALCLDDFHEESWAFVEMEITYPWSDDQEKNYERLSQESVDALFSGRISANKEQLAALEKWVSQLQSKENMLIRIRNVALRAIK